MGASLSAEELTQLQARLATALDRIATRLRNQGPPTTPGLQDPTITSADLEDTQARVATALADLDQRTQERDALKAQVQALEAAHAQQRTTTDQTLAAKEAQMRSLRADLAQAKATQAQGPTLDPNNPHIPGARQAELFDFPDDLDIVGGNLPTWGEKLRAAHAALMNKVEAHCAKAAAENTPLSATFLQNILALRAARAHEVAELDQILTKLGAAPPEGGS